MRIPALALAALLAGACDDGGGAAGGAALADTVVEAPADTGSGTHDAAHAVDGVHGAGTAAGNSEDVFTIGDGAAGDGWIVLSWGGAAVADGPGADLAVFENAFAIGGGPETFMDPAIVYASRDGASWVAFPHDYAAADETAYSALPEDWIGFAGVTPVLLHEERNPVDPFDAAAAGGDLFDIADLPDAGEGAAIKAAGLRYVKIVSATAAINPDTGAPYARDPIADGADVDGVYGRYLTEE